MAKNRLWVVAACVFALIAAALPAGLSARAEEASAVGFELSETYPIDISVEEETVTLQLGGEPYRLTLVVVPETATAGKTVTWIADNPNVVAVDGQNRLHALAEGTTALHMNSDVGGFTDSLTFRVEEIEILPEGITLDKTEYTGKVGENFYLTPSIRPENAVNAGFGWHSSDTRVAIVNNGTVMLIGEGTCIITVRDDTGAYTATCNVTVRAADGSAAQGGNSAGQEGEEGEGISPLVRNLLIGLSCGAVAIAGAVTLGVVFGRRRRFK